MRESEVDGGLDLVSGRLPHRGSIAMRNELAPVPFRSCPLGRCLTWCIPMRATRRTMKLTKRFTGWRITAQQIEEILDLANRYTSDVSKISAFVMNVKLLDNSSWDFDNLEQFIAEVEEDAFWSFQLSTDSIEGVETTITCSESDTTIYVTLPGRDQLQEFIDSVEHLVF
jgi:hypothetical protein